MKRGLALLLAKQEAYDPAVERGRAPKTDAKAGPREWPYEGVYRVGGEIPIGYRVGGTSIAASALIEAQDGKLSDESAAAVRRALDFVLEGVGHPLMTKDFEQGYDVRGWGHAYGLSFLLLLRERKLVPKELAERVDQEITRLVHMLETTEIESGGWNYSRPNGTHADVMRKALEAKRAKEKKPNAPARPEKPEKPEKPGRDEARQGIAAPAAEEVPEEHEAPPEALAPAERALGDDAIPLSPPSPFMTAPTLQILFEAARQGEHVDAGVVERALNTLEDARLDTGSFQYSTNPARKSGKGIEAVAGACARMAVCETTLYLAGRGSIDRMRGAVDAFFEHWQALEDRRKKSGTHEGPYAIAPYFFFYGHRYAAQAIEFLPEAERAGYRAKLYALLWKVREEDGGWNDRVFPRSESYGTAMTLFALHEPTARRPATWASGAKKSAK